MLKTLSVQLPYKFSMDIAKQQRSKYLMVTYVRRFVYNYMCLQNKKEKFGNFRLRYSEIAGLHKLYTHVNLRSALYPKARSTVKIYFHVQTILSSILDNW